MRRSLGKAVIVAALGVMLAPMSAPAQSATVVADGLTNPRGLDIVSDALYVAEAGAGGDRCIGEDSNRRCFGTTGAVTRVDLSSGASARIASKLPSIAAPGGSGAVGPADVSFGEAGSGGTLVTGLDGTLAARDSLGALGRRLGSLLRLSESGRICLVADLARFEAEHDPGDGQTRPGVDSNPISVEGSGGHLVAVDARGASLVGIGPGGVPRALAVFPSRTALSPGQPSEAVAIHSAPSSVARGPDGSYYVAERTSLPDAVGTARIYRVSPEGGTLEVFAAGFSQVTDIAWGPDQALYVLEAGAAPGDLTSVGKLIRVRPDGARSELAAGELERPAGLAVADDGTIYVSVGNAAGTVGQVLALESAGETERVVAEAEYAGRHLRIVERSGRTDLEVDGRVLSQRAFARVENGYSSQIAPFQDFADPLELARRLIDGDGTLWVL